VLTPQIGVIGLLQRVKRAATQCEIHQVRNLDYTEPAFEISVRAEDDKSIVKLFLDIGTVQGGSDVLQKQELGGQTTVLAKVSLHV
jgi:hypothetical protein